MTRDTVGKIALDLAESFTYDTHTAHDQAQENLKDYWKVFMETLSSFKQTYPKRDFYIEIQTKKERLLPNVLRNYFIGKLACPTPTYDQALFFYKHEREEIHFMWVIPAKDVCLQLLHHPPSIGEEEYQLYKFVLDFKDGVLFKLAKKLNKED